MSVRDVMQTRVVTASPATTLPEALKLLQSRRIRHLPVVDDGELVGIVSDRDLKRAMASPATSLEAHELRYLLERLPAREIMTRAVITIGPDQAVEEAARLLVHEKISALPVTDGKALVGIVTETDLLTLLVEIMGAGEPSSRLEVALGTAPSALADLVAALAQAGVVVSSLVTVRGRDGRRSAIVRTPNADPGSAIAVLTTRGHAVAVPRRE